MDKKFITNFVKGSLSTSSGQFFTVIIHFLSISILARYIPKDELGIYVLILAICIFLQLVVGLGLDITLVKFISGNREKREENVFIPILILRIGSLFLFSLLFYSTGHLILALFDERINPYLFYIPIIFSLGSIRELFFYLLQGLNLFKKFALVQVCSAIVKFSMILAFLTLNILTLKGLILIEIITHSFSILIQVFCTPFQTILRFNLSSQTFRSVIQFGFPLYLNNILGVINNRASTFIIGYFANPASIAMYEVAKKIPEALARMFQSFIVVYFPNLSRLFSLENKHDAEKLMNNSLILFSVGILHLVFIGFLFKREFIILVFSDNYLQTAGAFSLLMLNFYLKSISTIMGYSLVSAGYSSAPVKINSVSCFFNIIGGILMIPRWGFMGAVFALLAMNSIALIITSLFLVKAKISLKRIECLKPPLILAIIIIAFLILNPQSMMIKLLFVAFYIGFSWVFILEFKKTVNIAVKYFRDNNLKSNSFKYFSVITKRQ